MFSSSVNVKTASAQAAEGAVIIDVRSKSEWKQIRVPGAVHVSLDSIPHTQQAIQRRFQDKTVLVLCRSGSRSARATSMFKRMGIDATNIKGGIVAWNKQGLPVTQ